MRVLRYLPANLSAPDIARELSVSVTTCGRAHATCSSSPAPAAYDRGHLFAVVPGKISVYNGVLPGR
jgi:hypothetical protein